MVQQVEAEALLELAAGMAAAAAVLSGDQAAVAVVLQMFAWVDSQPQIES